MQLAENKFIDLIKEEIVIGDGAMGTMIQNSKCKQINPPELFMLEYPGEIARIHQEYVNAGAELIETNTFGANRLKLALEGLEDRIEEINKKAVEIARGIGDDILVAGSVGPTGKLMEPHGELSFSTAKAVFSEQIGYLVEAGVDLICIETMSDLKEMRAGVVAAREYQIPLVAQMTYTDRGLTLTGSTPELVAIVLDGLGVDMVGVNCVAGLDEAIPIVSKMSEVTGLPLSVFANAGLPIMKDNQTFYPQSAKEYSIRINELLTYNVRLIGGCCGTTPEYIPSIKGSAKKNTVENKNSEKTSLFLTSNHKHIEVSDNKPVQLIGEKLNPTGRDDLKTALRSRDWKYLKDLAKKQVIAGANLLDVNIGISGIDKKEVMGRLVQELQLEVDVPLVLDSNSPDVLEKALQEYTGKALINSVNGDLKSIEAIMPLAKKYGAALIGLTLDEKGIPATVDGRVAIAKRIIEAAEEYAIKRSNIVIDTLALTAGAKQKEVLIAVKALAEVKELFGVKTTLGISNVSHGLPGRELINETFLTMALGAGLDLPIINPFNERIYHIIRAANLLTSRDEDGREFIRWYNNNEGNRDKDFEEKSKGNKTDILEDIHATIIDGNKDNIVAYTRQAVEEGTKPQQVIDEALIPGIEEVGELYDQGTYFLPQLLRSAETVQAAFDYLKGLLGSDTEVEKKALVLLATVKGDMHDIGKNIVKTIFANHGFEVIDLGANVDTELIVEKAFEYDVNLVGLSALMTTTMEEMRNVVSQLKKKDFKGAVIIGGAVTSQEYANEIGAEIYAEDALDGVRKINSYLKRVDSNKRK